MDGLGLAWPVHSRNDAVTSKCITPTGNTRRFGPFSISLGETASARITNDDAASSSRAIETTGEPCATCRRLASTEWIIHAGSAPDNVLSKPRSVSVSPENTTRTVVPATIPPARHGARAPSAGSTHCHERTSSGRAIKTDSTIRSIARNRRRNRPGDSASPKSAPRTAKPKRSPSLMRSPATRACSRHRASRSDNSKYSGADAARSTASNPQSLLAPSSACSLCVIAAATSSTAALTSGLNSAAQALCCRRLRETSAQRCRISQTAHTPSKPSTSNPAPRSPKRGS
ncbi:MAG: hypothetical protein BWX86_00872 [Verrucomicrobia bacterium ADurb.Bin122]|nr:MAG: hypothetical protein BWX86_00872 [Verrucomicrobia bacterium ADurb.Bin122]